MVAGQVSDFTGAAALLERSLAIVDWAWYLIATDPAADAVAQGAHDS